MFRSKSNKAVFELFQSGAVETIHLEHHTSASQFCEIEKKIAAQDR